jgi:hypothetical protein
MRSAQTFTASSGAAARAVFRAITPPPFYRRHPPETRKRQVKKWVSGILIFIPDLVLWRQNNLPKYYLAVARWVLPRGRFDRAEGYRESARTWVTVSRTKLRLMAAPQNKLEHPITSEALHYEVCS